MSGLILSGPRAGQTPTARPDALLQKAFPSPPTATRSFRVDETLAALFEVYRGTSASKDPLRVVTSIVDADGEVRSRSEEQLTKGSESQIVQNVSLPLAGLPSGRYTLRVEAFSGNVDRSITRQVPFSVVPADVR